MILPALMGALKPPAASASNWSANGATLDALDAYLKAAWKFSTGAIATDSVGSNDWTNAGAAEDASGKSGYCALFDGSNDSMSQTMGTELKPSGQFSVSLWMKWVDLPGTGATQTIFYANPSDLNWILQFYNSSGQQKVQGGVWQSDGTSPQVDGNVSISNVAYHHIVMTATTADNKVHIYIDNVEVGTGTAWDGTMETSAGTIYLGQKGDSSRWLDGRLDEVYIWHTGLTSAQVSALYNSGTGAFYTG